ncbi:MAG: two-component system sensor histidine kinase NtrB [Chloroflexota bacterium]
MSQPEPSSEALRALIDSLPFAVYVVDRDYTLITANAERAQRNQCTPQELAGQTCYQVLYQRETPCPGCLVHETLQHGKRTSRVKHVNENNLGAQVWEIGTYPILDQAGEAKQAVLLEQDVTERQRLESIVAQSEQLAAIGQLAAGVAHEINNPLTAILANAQLLAREITPEDDRRDLVDMIAEAGARAAQVVRSLLDLARLEEYKFLPTDVNETIRKAIEMVKHEIISKSISLESNLSSTLPLIQASQSHLQGVWVNLLLNAADAIENIPGEINIQSYQKDDEIHVVIRDNGKGIAPENLAHIFDPFYTTKSAGRGTGLGLSICDRVIKRHEGRIALSSELGKGTTIIVMLKA